MTMTTEKLAELKRVAQNAWPGPWAMNPDPFDNDGTPETVVSAMDGKAAICVTMDWGKNNPLMREANALHIAACDPQTILSLIALAERALQPEEGQILDAMYDAIEDTPEAAATFWREEPEPGMPLAVERFTWHLKVQVPPGRANFENLFTARQMIAHGRKCWEAGRASQLALPAAQQLIGAGHFTMGKSGRWAEVDRNVPNSTILYHGPEWPETNADPFSHEERTAADVRYQMMKTSYEAEIKQLREQLALPAGPVPEGWKLVPNLMTDEMTAAAAKKMGTTANIDAAYVAALAAAPKPPAFSPAVAQPGAVTDYGTKEAAVAQPVADERDASDAYFKARHPMLDTTANRNVFSAGFRAALSRAIPEGHVVVPKEPTDAMIHTGGESVLRLYYSGPHEPGDEDKNIASCAYSAMISAAPAPEGEE